MDCTTFVLLQAANALAEAPTPLRTAGLSAANVTPLRGMSKLQYVKYRLQRA
jgi:hypothetical protein